MKQGGEDKQPRIGEVKGKQDIGKAARQIDRLMEKDIQVEW